MDILSRTDKESGSASYFMEGVHAYVAQGNVDSLLVD